MWWWESAELPCRDLVILGLDLSGTEQSYRLCLLFEGMSMEDWGMVEGVSYPYVATGHLVSEQVREKEGGKAIWDCPGRGEDPKYYGPPIHGLEWTDIKGFFGKAWTFKRAKGRSLVQS